MTPEQFWDGDVWLAQDFYRANRLSIQRRSEEMWLQGLYIFDAVSVALSNVLRKKGAKPGKYLEEPIRLTPLTEEEKAAKAQEEREKLMAYLNGFKKTWDGKKPRPES